MMHRRGGKRIRMDDPVPLEFETPMTPMTPMTDQTDHTDNTDHIEHPDYMEHTDYERSEFTERTEITEPMQHTELTERTEPTDLTEPTERTEATDRSEHTDFIENTDQTEHTEPTEQSAGDRRDYSLIYRPYANSSAAPVGSEGSPNLSQNLYREQSVGYETPTQFEQPMIPTPVNMRITRNTRARLRGSAIQKPVYKEVDTEPDRYIPAPSRGRGGGRGRGKRAVHTNLEDEASLYFVVRSNRTTLTSIVDEWIEKYKVNRDNALLMLMQFFISAAGCKGRITAELQTLENVHIIRRMTEEFDEDLKVKCSFRRILGQWTRI